MDDPKHLAIVNSHACPGCGQAVVCGHANGQATCWCMQFEHVLPVTKEPGALCYCEACLREKIAAGYGRT